MPRRSAFSFELLDILLQPPMRHVFAAANSLSSPFELSLTEKLQALKRMLDDEAHRGQDAASA